MLFYVTGKFDYYYMLYDKNVIMVYACTFKTKVKLFNTRRIIWEPLISYMWKWEGETRVGVLFSCSLKVKSVINSIHWFIIRKIMEKLHTISSKTELIYCMHLLFIIYCLKVCIWQMFTLHNLTCSCRNTFISTIYWNCNVINDIAYFQDDMDTYVMNVGHLTWESNLHLSLTGVAYSMIGYIRESVIINTGLRATQNVWEERSSTN